jgi:hypothetical protein
MDYTAMIEESWTEIREYMTTLFRWQGAEDLAAEELAGMPGMDEILGLLMVRHWRRGVPVVRYTVQAHNNSSNHPREKVWLRTDRRPARSG